MPRSRYTRGCPQNDLPLVDSLMRVIAGSRCVEGTEVHLHKAPERKGPPDHQPPPAISHWLVRPLLGASCCRMTRVRTVFSTIVIGGRELATVYRGQAASQMPRLYH